MQCCNCSSCHFSPHVPHHVQERLLLSEDNTHTQNYTLLHLHYELQMRQWRGTCGCWAWRRESHIACAPPP